ncbi:acyl-CoA thioesterase [Fundicoccus culcitae]|uniref:Acyl-CoA thioesterase n=1 Tax=Fundicoccus culcitae TaxID=2969821 RepID=A0ABY5P4E8_9LACT|nr:hotdog domain-containing protein [Fundicoccus culcitae]UUX33624.1 acyl-CoA thioesterase [Fundicoccus culcitae]
MPSQTTCHDTYAVQTHNILPSHINYHQTLYGGQLLNWLDNCASISFRRLARQTGVTASVDSVNFLRPLPLSHSVCIHTMVSGTSTRSVEIFAKVVGEDLETGDRYLAATAFLTFVTTPSPEGDAPTPLPQIVPETDEEKYVCSGYQKRRQARLDARVENQEFNANITTDLPWS